MDAAAVADAFAVADATRPTATSWRTFILDPGVVREFERTLRDCEMRIRGIRQATMPGACTLECRGAIRCRNDVRVYAMDGDGDTLLREPGTSRLLHVCVPGACRVMSSALHAHECTNELRRVRFPLFLSRAAAGGVYFCERHCRAHICTRANCPATAPSAHSFRVCVLSGQTVAAKHGVEYGTGNRMLSASIERERARTETDRRAAMAIRRSQGAMAIETLLNASTEQNRVTHALDGSTVAEPAAAPDADVDAPAPDVFSDRAADNTFGDGMATTLAQLYAEAYTMVHWLLFSDERAAIEAKKHAAVLNEAQHRIDAYVASQTKAHEPVLLHVCRQLERRALNSRRLFPHVLVPHGAVARMTAYYALVSLECYLQLMQCAAALQDTPNDATKRACDRYLLTACGRIVPNVLALLHSGLRTSTSTIAIEEPMLSFMPESQTIEELGIAQKVCTQIKKDMRKIIIAASTAAMPPACLRLTQLDMTDVMFGTEPVITTFLAARKRRIQ